VLGQRVALLERRAAALSEGRDLPSDSIRDGGQIDLVANGESASRQPVSAPGS